MKKYTVIDIETTGFEPSKGAEITEIAGINIVDGEIVTAYSSLCYINGEVSEFITNLTGINKKMTNNAPNFKYVFCCLMESLMITDKTNLVIHNSKFDYTFIDYYVKQNNFNKLYIEWWKDVNIICSLELSRELLPNQSHKLEVLKDQFGIKSKSHRALNDCIVTHKVYENLLKIQKGEKIL